MQGSSGKQPRDEGGGSQASGKRKLAASHHDAGTSHLRPYRKPNAESSTESDTGQEQAPAAVSLIGEKPLPGKMALERDARGNPAWKRRSTMLTAVLALSFLGAFVVITIAYQ